jgi:type IV pilus assembly protein PilM
MMFGFGEKKIVGLDIGTSSIKLAELDHSRRGFTLKKFGVYPLSPGLINGGEIVEPSSVADCVTALFKTTGSRRKHVCSGIWGSAVIVKKISMERMHESVLAENIKYEAEQYISFKLDEISLEHHILRGQAGSGSSMEVLLVAAKQEFLYRFLETVEQAPNLKLQLAIVDVAGFALANCFEANYGVVEAPIALLNIGAGVSNFIVLDRGEVVYSRDIPVGGQTYTMEINKQMGVPFAEAESHKISASSEQPVPQEVPGLIASVNEFVVDEIRTVIDAYGSTASGAPLQRIFFSGGSMFIRDLLDQISRAVNLPYEIFDPFKKVSYDTKAFTSAQISQIKAISPVVLGLAMRKVAEK